MPVLDNESYPSRLLPKTGDKYIAEPDLSEFLCRWTNPAFPLKDEQGKLTALAIEERRLFHYSVNKIPRSEVEDVFIEFLAREPFLEHWEEGSPPPVIRDEDFRWERNRGFFLVPIKAVHLHQGFYPFPANNESPDYVFTVKVVHRPLQSNFMHFELHVLDDEGNLLSEIKQKAWRKIIVAELRQHIIEVAKFQF